MTFEEFIDQEHKMRKNIHYYDSVWWRMTSFQCCHPLYELQEIPPRQAAPSPWKSIIRYSHLVPKGYPSNQKQTRLLLQGDRLKSFSLKDLKRKRRQLINRAIRHGLVVREIDYLEDHWRDLQEIFISTAKRTRYGLPDQYYIERESEWRENLQREFDLKGRDWFGIYEGKKLISYLYSCMVDDTAILLATKCNADYLRVDPNDLLLFHVISYYKDQPQCQRVDAGWAISIPPSIDWRKTQLGFERVELPVFQKMNRAALLGLRIAVFLAQPILRHVQSDSQRNMLYKFKRIEKIIENMKIKDY